MLVVPVRRFFAKKKIHTQIFNMEPLKKEFPFATPSFSDVQYHVNFWQSI